MKPGFAYDGTESSFNLRVGVFCNAQTANGQSINYDEVRCRNDQ